MRTLWRAWIALILTVAPAAARDIFVSNTRGNDAFLGDKPASVGRERGGPVATIARALRLASPGDRIILENTGIPYRESVTLAAGPHSGVSYNRFRIVGSGAILDGSLPVPVGGWEHYSGPVFRFSPPRGGPQQLFLRSRPAPRVIADELLDRPPTLEPLQWTEYQGDIYFAVEPDKLPRDYPLTYAALPTGITLFHCHDVLIRDLTVQGFRLDGISAFNSARDVVLSNVTCRGNARAGLTVGGASRVLIDGCLLGNNGEAQLLTLPYSETHVRGSDLLGNTAPARVDQGGELFVAGEPAPGNQEEIYAEPEAETMPPAVP